MTFFFQQSQGSQHILTKEKEEKEDHLQYKNRTLEDHL